MIDGLFLSLLNLYAQPRPKHIPKLGYFSRFLNHGTARLLQKNKTMAHLMWSSFSLNAAKIYVVDIQDFIKNFQLEERPLGSTVQIYRHVLIQYTCLTSINKNMLDSCT